MDAFKTKKPKITTDVACLGIDSPSMLDTLVGNLSELTPTVVIKKDNGENQNIMIFKKNIRENPKDIEKIIKKLKLDFNKKKKSIRIKDRNKEKKTLIVGKIFIDNKNFKRRKR